MYKMMNKMTNRWRTALMLLFAAAAGVAGAQSAVVSTSAPALEGGTPPLDGLFTVEVAVTENTILPAVHPLNCSFVVVYPGDVVEFLGANEGDLGAAAAGPPVDLGGGMHAVAVATIGYNSDTLLPNTTNRTPLCVTLDFRLMSTPAAPFTITVMDNPASSRPLPANAAPGFANIPHVFDNSGTTDLQARTPAESWMIY